VLLTPGHCADCSSPLAGTLPTVPRLLTVGRSVLQEARHQLTMDLQNKTDALDVDRTCLTLTVKSAQISLKTDPLRIPAG